MTSSSKSTAILFAVVAIGLVVFAILILRNERRPVGERTTSLPQPKPDQIQNASDATLFQDETLESGIDFEMNFLPAEQGEKFKINLYDHGCGVAVSDYDGDGHEDIYFLNQLGPNALYKNRSDGTFINTTSEAGDLALADRISVGAVFGDYDNDGDRDLYVTTTRGGNVLFQNQGGGRFLDVTEKAGLTCVAHSQTAAFFDADNDRDLDLLVTNSAQWTVNDVDGASRYFPGVSTLWELGACQKELNKFYRNNGNGTFTEATDEVGLGGKGWGGDVAIFDFDEDGHIDVFVTNMFGQSQLYRNAGTGRFEEVTKDTLGRTSWGAIGSKAFDYNNDGRLDLLVVDMHSDMWMPYDYDLGLIDEQRKYPFVTGPTGAGESEDRFADQFQIRYREVIFGNTLFRNLGEGKFDEVSDQAKLESFWPWGIATGDFDNNGYEDVFLPSGMGHPWSYWKNSLMMNSGDGTFSNRSASAGIEPPRDGIHTKHPIRGKPTPRSSRCAATADFDGDGQLDLVVNNFNDRPYYFKNQSPRQNFVSFQLKGTASNGEAIGAVVRVSLGEQTLTRQVQAAGGYLSQSSRKLHFGLGGRSEVDRVEIRWPSGRRQTIESPKINVCHEITEAD